jgi:hypothetical protein
MKKSHLLGIEVFYEDKPEEQPESHSVCCPIGHEGVKGWKGEGAWKYGDDEDDWLDPPEPYDDDLDEDIEEIKSAFESVHDPVRGRIYKVKGLGICAKYVEDVANVLKITCGVHGKEDSVGFQGGVVRKMAYHKSTFYIDEKNMLFASDEEVAEYLAERDYNNTP